DEEQLMRGGKSACDGDTIRERVFFVSAEQTAHLADVRREYERALCRTAQLCGPRRKRIQAIGINDERRHSLLDEGTHEAARPFIISRQAGAERDDVGAFGQSLHLIERVLAD